MKKITCECCELELNYDIDASHRRLINVVVNAVTAKSSTLDSVLVQEAMLQGDSSVLPGICRKQCDQPCGAGQAIAKLQEDKN